MTPCKHFAFQLPVVQRRMSWPPSEERLLETKTTEKDYVRACRALLVDLAGDLSQDDIATIVFIENLPHSLKECSAVKVLSLLERQGVFSPYKTQPLAELFKSIKRMDLALHLNGMLLLHFVVSFS